MKGSSLIATIVLFVAVVVLYVLQFTGGGKAEPKSGSTEAVVARSGDLRIAYVKADSIILNYKLAEDLHDTFTKKQEAFTTEYGTKRQSFEKDATAFQEKLQRGGFLSEQSAVRERDRLVGMEQEILKMDQELSTKLAEEQAANNQQILDSLMNTINELNASKTYDYIFNAANILVGDEAEKLTGKGLNIMNEKYEASLK